MPRYFIIFSRIFVEPPHPLSLMHINTLIDQRAPLELIEVFGAITLPTKNHIVLTHLIQDSKTKLILSGT